MAVLACRILDGVATTTTNRILPTFCVKVRPTAASVSGDSYCGMFAKLYSELAPFAFLSTLHVYRQHPAALLENVLLILA